MTTRYQAGSRDISSNARISESPTGTRYQRIARLRERVSARMNVSVAEVGQQELWNRADLAFVTVAAQKEVTEKRLSAIAKLLEEGRDFVLLELKTEPL